MARQPEGFYWNMDSADFQRFLKALGEADPETTKVLLSGTNTRSPVYSLHDRTSGARLADGDGGPPTYNDAHPCPGSEGCPPPGGGG